MKTKSGDVIEERKTPASLQMTYLITPPQKKLPAVVQLLQNLEPRPLRSIIFLSTCAAVDYFSHVLSALLPEGFQLNILHGKQDAKVREKGVAKFLSATEPSILLTTDVAARGSTSLHFLARSNLRILASLEVPVPFHLYFNAMGLLL